MSTTRQERAEAYARVMSTLEELKSTKLQPAEAETIRAAADDVLFGESAYDALATVEDLTERLVEADRWTPERARRLVDDIAACGSLAA